jgi:predicted DNA-binding WGR domain protein/Leucine-rich repeat (LRR) protein
MEKHLTYKDDKSDKFWKIELEGENFTVIFGKTGTAGQSQTKTFENEEKCEKEAEKLINEKLKKGYVENAASTSETNDKPVTGKKEVKDNAPVKKNSLQNTTRNFICLKGNSDKFWTVSIKDTNLINTYGKNSRYEEPKSVTKSFSSVEQCEKEAEKQIASKLKEDYQEVKLHFPKVPVYILNQLLKALETKPSKLNIYVMESEEMMKLICTMKYLTELVIQQVGVLPSEICNLQNLDHFEIRESQNLKAIPKEIGKLTRISRLTINDTSVQNLPDEIGNLKEMVNLRISGNTKLKALPDTIGLLTNLEVIYVQGNTDALNELFIPKSIGNLEKLTELQLPSNNLKTIPDEIGNLKSLTELDLNFNKIKTLPITIFSLENLERLELNYNQISTLPTELCDLKNLTDLDIEGCPITNVPDEVINEGIEAIVDFLGNGSKSKEKKKLDEVTIDPQIVNKYKDRLEKFYRGAKSKIYKDVTQKTLDEMIPFLTGRTNDIPFAKTDDVYYFSNITDVFAPFKEWTFIDNRVLAYLTQEAWSFKKDEDGYHKHFYRWLKNEISNNDFTGLFTSVFAILKNNGISENLILTQSLKEMSECAQTTNGEVSSYGQFLISMMNSKMDLILKAAKEYWKVKENIIDLFMKHKEKEFEQHIPQLIEIDKYKGSDGNLHIEYSVLETLCKVNPGKYESNIVDLIAQSDCASCIAESARLLKEYYGDTYRKYVFEIVGKTFEHISSSKNKAEQNYEFSWSLGERYSDGTPQYIEWVLKNYGKEARKIVFDYVNNTKVLDLDVIQVVVGHLGQEAVDVAAEALNMTIKNNNIAAHYRQLFGMLTGLDYSKYYDKVWEIAKSEFKDVRQTACLALSKLEPSVVIPKAKELLSSKTAHEREASVFILSLINSDECFKVLQPLLVTEKNDDVRDLIVESVYATDQTITIKEVMERVASASARGKLGKPAAKWLDEKALPKLKWNDKKPIENEVVQFLFHRQTRQKEIIPDPEVKDIYPLIEKESGGEFAVSLLKLILKNGGAKAPNRFALSVVGLLGDDRIIEPLQKLAIESMNENSCATLGLHYTLESARALNKIMQVFRIKYPNVKSAAKESFDNIAGKMELTPSELSDKMIPDFGFTNLRKIFKVGKDDYAAKIGRTLKLEFLDTANKLLKGLPKGTADDIQKEFKEIGIQLKELVKQQKINMENYLVVQRKWNRADWEEFYLKNPLAFAFAQNLIWAVYEKDNVKATFTVNEDAKIVDAIGTPVSINGDKIGLVHPIDLNDKEKAEWTKFILDAGIEPPFEQINRLVFYVNSENKTKTSSFMFESASLYGLTFKSRAEKLGWRRGSVVDAGEVSSYRKAFENKEVETFIRLEGLGVQSYEENVTIGELFFVKTGSVVTGSYTYDEPRNEQDPRLIKLGDIPKIVYSETISDLQKITKAKNDEEE